MRSVTWYYTLVFSLASGVVNGNPPKGKWDSFNFAPSSRTVYPTAIHSTSGSVTKANLLVNNKGAATLSGNGSLIALDFGIEVGGLISLNFDSVTSSSALSLSFTESPTFIRSTSSDDSASSSESTTFDGVLRVTAPLPKGHWTQPSDALRGGFRYLTLVSDSDAPLTISNVSCAISFMPHVDDLRAYTGYFYTPDDELLTKIWYSGAYTVQTNTIPFDTGRMVPPGPPGTWANNAAAGVASPIIVDGAKRDRAVWPGDMGIAVPTSFVSTSDLLPTKNALSTMFAAINPETGALPACGPPLSLQGSDSYHGWTLIGTYTYYLYSGDIEWLQTVWTNYTKAVAFLEGKVGSTGLMNVTGTDDWARQAGGGYSAEGNAILYKVLTTASELATHVSRSTLASAWAKNATTLKQAFNKLFWLESAGMYRDNATTTLCPQDANSFAVLFNITQSQTQKESISKGLTINWNEIGPVTPELPDTISPFVSGFEVQAHFEAGSPTRALELIRRTWGYMLTTPLSVQSTLLEGFTANGSLAYRYYRGYNNDPSYTSHAHGWSSGPTSALTYYILGLTVTAPQGRTWSVAPNVNGGLSSAQGGFTTPLGWFGVQWSLAGNVQRQEGSLKGTTFLNVQINTPPGTSGALKLPASALKGTREYSVDGVQVKYAEGHAVEILLKGGIHAVIFEK